MTQYNSELNEPKQPVQANPSTGAGVGASPAAGSSTDAASSSCSSSLSPSETSKLVSESPSETAINKELRRLNRALRALSACNQALGQAGSEQELLRQICDIIVRVGGIPDGGHRVCGTGRRENRASHGACRPRQRISGNDSREVVRYPSGARPGGYGDPREPDLRRAGYGERSAVCPLARGRPRTRIRGCDCFAAAGGRLIVRRAGHLFGAGGFV